MHSGTISISEVMNRKFAEFLNDKGLTPEQFFVLIARPITFSPQVIPPPPPPPTEDVKLEALAFLPPMIPCSPVTPLPPPLHPLADTLLEAEEVVSLFPPPLIPSTLCLPPPPPHPLADTPSHAIVKQYFPKIPLLPRPTASIQPRDVYSISIGAP